MKKNVGKKFRLMALLASLTLVLWGGVIACSNGSDDDGDDGKDPGKDETTPLVEDFSLSGITLTEPGVTVAKGEVFADLEESDKVTITITYNTSATTIDGYDSWFCYTIDGDKWEGDFEKADGKASVTITGEDITTLKTGSLTIYGNNADAKVTVTTDKKAVEGTGDDPADDGNKGAGDEDDDTTGGEQTTPPTLPTAIVLNNKIDGSNWAETTMTKSATDGIWTCELTISNQWPNFNVKATFGENDALYKGGEVKLNESGTITKDGSNDIWCDVGEKCNGAKISVTVNFTGTTPSIKIAIVEAGTVPEVDAKKPLVKLQGRFFEEGDDNTPWVYCSEQFKETESGIWEAEITSINSSGWDNFKVVITEDGTDIWYGINSDVKDNITNASLVKDNSSNLWLATAKGGKNKVTVNLNTMTVTVTAL